MKRRGDSCLYTPPPPRTRSIRTMYGVLVVCIGSKPGHKLDTAIPTSCCNIYSSYVRRTMYIICHANCIAVHYTAYKLCYYMAYKLYTIQRTRCTLYNVQVVELYGVQVVLLYGVQVVHYTAYKLHIYGVQVVVLYIVHCTAYCVVSLLE